MISGMMVRTITARFEMLETYRSKRLVVMIYAYWNLDLSWLELIYLDGLRIDSTEEKKAKEH